MKTSDIIVVGAGIIGLSLALELRRRDLHVMVIERGEPGQEASHAAAGMLAAFDHEHPPALRELAVYSWDLYPDFVEIVRELSGMAVPIQESGTLLVHPKGISGNHERVGFEMHARPLSAAEALKLEPELGIGDIPLSLLQEKRLDPQVLMRALIAAARHRHVEFVTGTEVKETTGTHAGVTVTTSHGRYAAGAVVNCSGAWSGTFGPLRFPVRPIKGQIFSILPQSHGLLRHTVRSKDVYLVPRPDGRVVVGATAEDAGFDKRVEPEVIQDMHRAAALLVPKIGQAKIMEAWAGLRPETPDQLPVMGTTSLVNYYVSTGHFRNGILLAPGSARIVADAITGAKAAIDTTPFRAARFADLMHAA